MSPLATHVDKLGPISWRGIQAITKYVQKDLIEKVFDRDL